MLRSNAYRLPLTLGVMALFFTPAFAQKLDFEKQVLPILKKNCVDCHKAAYKDKSGLLREPGSGLRLDGRYWIEKGSDHEKVILPGNAAKSPLLRRITLDADDPEIMPAEGDPLSKKEQRLLRKWISEGAEFGSWVGVKGPKGETRLPAPESPKAKRILLLEKLGKGMDKLPGPTIEKARGKTAQINPVQAGSPLLRVQYIANEASVSDATLKHLAPLRRHITHLNLAKTKITDRGLAAVGQMRKLTRLNLNKTQVTDRGLFQLSALDELRYLNLHGTKVTTEGVARLRRLLPKTKINYQRILPKPAEQPQKNRHKKRGAPGTKAKKRRKV